MNEPNGISRPGDVQKFLYLLAVATAILFIIAILTGIFSYYANKHRINDIQDARVASCERTYMAFKQVFKPFIPPIALRTPKQKADIHTFYALIKNLRANCDLQTGVVGN
jgi:hypothetical protein